MSHLPRDAQPGCGGRLGTGPRLFNVLQFVFLKLLGRAWSLLGSAMRLVMGRQIFMGVEARCSPVPRHWRGSLSYSSGQDKAIHSPLLPPCGLILGSLRSANVQTSKFRARSPPKSRRLQKSE